jgi:hypothetical protein
MEKIVTLEHAKQHNLSHYFTGKPCRNGHVAKRQVSNRGCVVCSYNRVKQFEAVRKGTPWRRHQRMLKLYGMSPETFQQMIKNQKGRCLTCNKLCSDLHVDHCHLTGKVRGLLCGPCNRALGMIKDNPDTLSRMIKYLLPLSKLRL